jgi:hypothetical protein
MASGVPMVQDATEIEAQTHRKGLSMGPIIAIVIFALLLGTGLFLLIWDPAVSEVTVINPDDVDTNGDSTFDSVVFTLVTVKDGMRGVDEKAKIEVTYNGKTTLSTERKVKSDQVSVYLKYDQFVIGNGVYNIKVSIDGASGQAPYSVSFVASSVNLSFTSSEDPSLGISNEFIVTPLFYGVQELGKGFRMSSYENMYHITLRITDPDGEMNEYSNTMGELPGNYSEIFEIDSALMGEYTAEVTFENRMVKEGSDLRELQGESGPLTEYVNRPPMITDLEVITSRPRINEDVEISIKATDLDSNGGVTTVLIWWDTSDNQLDLEEITVSSKTVSIKAKHVFDTATTYTIQVTVADNGPEWQGLSQKRYASQDLSVTVRVF